MPPWAKSPTRFAAFLANINRVVMTRSILKFYTWPFFENYFNEKEKFIV